METKTLDNESMASLALGVRLSNDKLRILEPRLYTLWGKFFNWRLSLGHKEKLTAQEVFEEHLRYGDAGPALVVSLEPLLVAAYASELDAVILLNFDPQLVQQYELELDQRLLCACTYEPMTESASNYAQDVIPGPGASGHFRNAAPLIADFLSDANAQIELIKNAQEPKLWAHVASLARQHMSYFENKSRDGKPIKVCFE